MPIHDWSRAADGTFHHFHNAWILELCAALNDGVLPANYYAVSEQVIAAVIPDVLTLHSPPQEKVGVGPAPAVATLETAPPQVRYSVELATNAYLARQKQVAIRRRDGHELVGVIEIVSPGNKSSLGKWEDFIAKIEALLRRGVHALIIDITPRTTRDPRGVHGSLGPELGDEGYDPPGDKPLSLASYQADEPLRAFVEPLAPGDTLIEMPVFLDGGRYVLAPLEATYLRAVARVPTPLRGEIEPSPQ